MKFERVGSTVLITLISIYQRITNCVAIFVTIQVDCLTMTNAKGFTPLHMAAQACHKYVVKLLMLYVIIVLCIIT